VHDQGYDEQNEKNDEENLGNAGCCNRDPAEAEYSGNYGKDQESDSQSQHDLPPFTFLSSLG
jgi:hypothetical protein